MQRLVLNKFYGGISNDPSVGGIGSVYNAEGVNIRNNSKCVKLSSNQNTGNTLLSTSENYKVISSIYESVTKFLEFSYAGRIININKNNFDSNYIVELGILYNSGVITTETGTYGFIIGATNKIYKWTYDSGDTYLGIGATGVNITNQTHTSNFNIYSPYIIIQNFIYIGAGNKIIEVDTTSSAWILTDVLTIDSDYTIKGITKISDQVFIYATDGSSTRQYLWDGVNTTTTRTVTWIDKPLQNIGNFANIDYVITGGNYSNETALWVVNGIQLTPVFKNPITSNNIKQRILFTPEKTNAIETIGNRFLIPNNGDIYTYGSETPGLPQSLIKEFLSPLNYISSINYVTGNAFNLNIYGYGEIDGISGSYRINHYLAGKYNKEIEGFIESQPLYGQTFSNEKNFEKITVGYELETDTSINLYYKLNNGINYSIIYIIFASEGDIPSIGDTYTQSSNTYTIYGISSIGLNTILYTTYTGTNDLYNGTYTRTSGIGAPTFYSNFARLEYKYIGSFTDKSLYRDTLNIPFNFNKTQIAFGLQTGNEDVTPKLYDVNLYYNEISDD